MARTQDAVPDGCTLEVLEYTRCTNRMTEDFDFEEIKKEIGDLPEPKVTEQDIEFVINTIS